MVLFVVAYVWWYITHHQIVANAHLYCSLPVNSSFSELSLPYRSEQPPSGLLHPAVRSGTCRPWTPHGRPAAAAAAPAAAVRRRRSSSLRHREPATGLRRHRVRLSRPAPVTSRCRGSRTPWRLCSRWGARRKPRAAGQGSGLLPGPFIAAVNAAGLPRGAP